MHLKQRELQSRLICGSHTGVHGLISEEHTDLWQLKNLDYRMWIENQRHPILSKPRGKTLSVESSEL